MCALDKPVIVKGLTKYFDNFCAVDRISFDVNHGEVLALLGPNGAGKTTTLKMLCGLLRPSEGTAYVGGMDIRRHPNLIKRKIGYMSQLFSLYEDLTVWENISFFGYLYGVSRERKYQILKNSRLVDSKDTLVRSLPSGERQTLALWIALMHKPEIVFLDEPTAGADPEQRSSFWNTVRELNVPAIVTTHYMEEAGNADRVALMNRGKIIAIDKPDNLKRDFSERWNLFSLSGEFGAELADQMRKMQGIVGVVSFGRDLHLQTLRTVSLKNIKSLLSDLGYADVKVAPINPSLEHVFFALVETSK